MSGIKRANLKILKITGVVLILFSVIILPKNVMQAQANQEPITVTANFTGREINPDEKIELKLSRDLKPDEGRLGIFVGVSDLTALFIIEPQTLSYAPKFAALPAGESEITIYLVSPADDWKMLAEFPLKIKATTDNGQPLNDKPSLQTISPPAPDPPPVTPETKSVEAATENSNKTKMEFTPNVSLNVKGQNQTLTFPRESEPERNPFTDLGGQGSVNFKVSRNGWAFGNQFDFAGSSFRQEALRFGELGERAPQIDLSSYLMTLEKGRFSVRFGHVSFGSNRHLINSFSSRGVTVVIPVGKQNEISLAAMNGTSIVGFGNFPGITRREHSVLSAAFAREFFRETPKKLRVEFSVMRGSLLPLSNFNQREVNDAERSLGFGFKVFGNNFKERLRYEVGVTRSTFRNPSDPLLEQGLPVTPISSVTRYARYGEISFDFLSDLKTWRDKKMKLTGTYRHEEIEPLYRSIGVSTQADRRQHQFEVSGNFGEMNFAYGNLRDRDNLRDIVSILRTLNRRENVVVGIPLNSFFAPSKPIKWLPQVSYTFDHTHQFGAFLPSNGDFRDESQVPDQHSFNHAFNAQWQISEKINFGYRYNRTFQDNRQPGRELADFLSNVNAASVSWKPRPTLGFDFELSRENLTNLEQPRTDRTFRVGVRVIWETPFLKNSVFSGGISGTLAGDTQNFNDARNAEFDAQWAYKFTFGKRKFKKLDTQFFVRYANRYGDTIDRQFFINNFNKTQSFNMGLTFNIF